MGQPFGRFELLERIGVGGMAEVWKSRVAGIGGFEKILVLKKILPAFAQNKTFIEMLLAEARLCGVLQHTNIVQTFENGEIDQQYYIAMEYVPGHDLFKVLSRATQVGRRLPPELCLYVAAEVAKGLAYAHDAKDHQGRPLNIIHRDVSPSNILISEAGEVKVMDFGVARATLGDGGEETSTRSGVLKGKLGYMSPEQVTGQPFDLRSDIFSLGIILYEAITLKRLFLGRTDLETLVNIRDARIEHKFRKHSYIDEGVRVILRKTLTRRPEDRYASALDMHDDIVNLLFESKIQVSNRTLAAFINELFDPALDPEAADVPVQPPEQHRGWRTTQRKRISALSKAKTEEAIQSATFSKQEQDAQRAEVLRRRQQAENARRQGEALVAESGRPRGAAPPRVVSHEASIVGRPEDTEVEHGDSPELTSPDGGSNAPLPVAFDPANPPKWAVESSRFGGQEDSSFGVRGEGSSIRHSAGPALVHSPEPQQSLQESRHRPIPLGASDPPRPDPAPEVAPAGRRRYQIRTGDGHVLGPLMEGNIEAMLRTRAAGPDLLVSDGSSAFRRLAEVTELRRVFDEVTAHRDAPAFRGQTSRLTHPRLLFRLYAQRVTGALEFRLDNALKCIYFRRGRPTHVASNQKLEMLGPFLTSQGFVNEAAVSQALAHIAQHGGRIGDVLIGLNLIKPFRLYQALERQFRAKFVDAFNWEGADFAFYEGEKPPADIVPLDLDPIALLIEGVQVSLPLSLIEPHFKDDLDRPYYRAGSPLISVEALRFQARETKALGVLMSSRTLREAVIERCKSRQQRLAILHVMLIMLQTEMLTFQPPV